MFLRPVGATLGDLGGARAEAPRDSVGVIETSTVAAAIQAADAGIKGAGAGDLFAGAFMYGLTHGLTFEQAGNLASKASSQIVSQFGPRLRLEQYQALT